MNVQQPHMLQVSIAGNERRISGRIHYRYCADRPWGLYPLKAQATRSKYYLLPHVPRTQQRGEWCCPLEVSGDA